MKIQQSIHKLSSGEEYCVREVVPDDAVRIIDYVKNVLTTSDYLITAPEEFTQNVQDEIDWIRNIGNLDNDLLIMAVIDTEVIGLLSFRAKYKKRIKHCGIFGMTVAKNYRGKGVGEVLMKTLLNWAENNPVIRKVMLEVVIENIPAISLYKKLGFITEGIKVKDILLDSGEYADVIQMYKFVK